MGGKWFNASLARWRVADGRGVEGGSTANRGCGLGAARDVSGQPGGKGGTGLVGIVGNGVQPAKGPKCRRRRSGSCVCCA